MSASESGFARRSKRPVKGLRPARKGASPSGELEEAMKTDGYYTTEIRFKVAYETNYKQNTFN